MKAGTCLVDITPKLGVQLAGYPHCPRPNVGVHDPIYAACLYLSNGKSEVCIVTMDLLYFGKKHVKEIRDKFPMPILFTTTHTHCAPWASEVLASEKAEGIDENPEYIAELMVKVEDGIRKAIENTFEAEVGSYVGRCGAEQGVGGNRREKGGICDPSVNVLAVRDMDAKIRAILVNYALHPTYLHAENELVTADYPGYIRRFFHFAHPDAMVMFAQGASGNQSSRYHRVAQDFEEAARVGSTIGVEVFHCIERMTFEKDADLVVASEETDMPLKTYPTIPEAEKAVAEARAKFESLKGGDYIPMRNAELAMFGAENTLSYAREVAKGYKSCELPCEVFAVRIGDAAIVTTQGEMFVDFALEMKENSPIAKTFVFTVSNGALPGYIYTPQAGIEGGYEVGTSMLAPEAGAVVVKLATELLHKIK